MFFDKTIACKNIILEFQWTDQTALNLAVWLFRQLTYWVSQGVWFPSHIQTRVPEQQLEVLHSSLIVRDSGWLLMNLSLSVRFQNSSKSRYISNTWHHMWLLWVDKATPRIKWAVYYTGIVILCVIFFILFMNKGKSDRFLCSLTAACWVSMLTNSCLLVLRKKLIKMGHARN